MIFDKIENFGRYKSLNPNFRLVEKYINNNDLRKLAPGKHEISKDVFVISETVPGKDAEDAVLEAHKNYIDVQLCLNSTDNMGWTALEDCKSVKDEYDPARDLVFFNDEIQRQLAVSSENFIIFFPWDAHAPNIGSGDLQKIIFKVKV